VNPCPICTHPRAREILEGLRQSKSEGEACAGVPHATFWRWVDRHNALPVHAIGVAMGGKHVAPRALDPLTSTTEEIQRDAIVRLLVIVNDERTEVRDRVSALRGIGQIGASIRSAQLRRMGGKAAASEAAESEKEGGAVPPWLTQTPLLDEVVKASKASP
jgi:hypothetical protein